MLPPTTAANEQQSGRFQPSQASGMITRCLVAMKMVCSLKAFTTNRASGTHTIKFCTKLWMQQAGVTINGAFPYHSIGMKDDYSMKAPSANEVDYYRSSTAGVLAHGSHHV